MYYYSIMQFGFVPGKQLELTQASMECSALRQAYTERLRASPSIGMDVAFGTIIDLRPPLALIQYNAFGRQIKGQEQDWVQCRGRHGCTAGRVPVLRI